MQDPMETDAMNDRGGGGKCFIIFTWTTAWVIKAFPITFTANVLSQSWLNEIYTVGKKYYITTPPLPHANNQL